MAEIKKIDAISLVNVRIDDKYDFVVVTFSTDGECFFPAVFLRNNCVCPKCFDASAYDNKICMGDVNPDIKATEVKIGAKSWELNVKWDDDHESCFPSDWLWKRRFTDNGRNERSKWYRRKPRLWGSEIVNNVPTDTFDNILADEKALFNWLVTLEEIGLFIITDAPAETGQLAKLADRVAYLRKNNYGTTFQVQTKKNPSNVAYTALPIGMHTDLPYFDYVPGMQMLHCIKQADLTGGDNGFADGFWAAQQLRDEHPYYFELLTTQLLDYWDFGEDYTKYYMLDQKPMIRLNEKGEVVQINHNPQSLDSYLSAPPEKVKDLYKAMRTFDDMLYSKDNVFHVKMKSGDIACFHNYRVLHSRTGFTASGEVQRHLEGGYIDWDELSSKRRLLEIEHGF